MKSVVIPNTEKPMWECEINGLKFRYQSGSVQTVPDDVASVIANVYGAVPVPAEAPEPGQVWTYREGGPVWETVETGSSLPPYDNGKCLRSTASGVEWAAPTATVPAATLDAAGVVKMGSYVGFIPLDGTPSAEGCAEAFNALRESLIEAGIISGVYPESDDDEGDPDDPDDTLDE